MPPQDISTICFRVSKDMRFVFEAYADEFDANLSDFLRDAALFYIEHANDDDGLNPDQVLQRRRDKEAAELAAKTSSLQDSPKSLLELTTAGLGRSSLRGRRAK